MGIVGSLHDYSIFQAAEAMKAAADNPSGGASDGIGMGMGFAMAQKMGETLTSHGPTPPPVPPQTTYFIAVGTQQTGPFSIDVIKDKINSNQITSQTLIWSPTLVDWTAASKIPELIPLFTAKPPPIPGS